MNYRLFLPTLLFLFLLNCSQSSFETSGNKDLQIQKRYKNSGFALISVSEQKNMKQLEPRSLKIYHKNLKRRSVVKITNPDNGKYLIAEVKSNRVKFSSFYNCVLSLRIAEDLELNLNEPYVEIALIPKNSTFVAKKAKMFDEERTVAEKAPVDGIQINDLKNTTKKKKKIKTKNFFYLI